MEVTATIGAIRPAKSHHLQTGRPSCRPTNSVRALKGENQSLTYSYQIPAPRWQDVYRMDRSPPDYMDSRPLAEEQFTTVLCLVTFRHSPERFFLRPTLLTLIYRLDKF